MPGEIWAQIVLVLVLLVLVNGAPVLVARVLRSSLEYPVDRGRILADGYRLFGDSKTWRGIFAALLMGATAAWLLGYGALFGTLFAVLAMVGDLFSSYVKRRRGLAPSARSHGLDQVPEALLPSLYAVDVLSLSWWWAILLPLLFTLLHQLVSRPLYRLNIRERPY